MTYKPRVILDELGARDFKPSGLPGSSAASRYVGATATGAPSSGTHSTGDFVIAQNGSVWICTIAGTPGTWMAVAGGTTGGSLLNWRGTWLSSASYAVNDVVLYATQLWVAAQSSMGATPQVVVPPYNATILADSPSIYWRLDEPSGSTAADFSGNGRTGTIIGGVTYALAGAIAGDSDTAMGFNGTSGWVQGNASFNNPAPVSVECWFKTTATSGVLVEFDSGSTQHDRAIWVNSDGTLSWFCWQVTTGTTITSPASYNDGNWHHAVGTVGSGGQLLYVDGAQVASSANTFPQNYSGHWEIANGPNGGFFNGTLDEVAIWNATQLTSSQVATHYNTGHASSVYWMLLAVDNPMTNAGDMIYGGSAGIPTRLPAGVSNTLLTGGATPGFTASPSVSGELTASDFKPSGLPGATSASRYVGATASGAPTSGTFAVGDFVIDQTAKIWVCTVAGTPGIWAQLSGGGSSTLAGDTDVAITSPVGGQVLGYNGSTAKWQNQNVAGVAATTSRAQLGTDVTLSSANTYYDGPSVTLSPGTWLLSGVATVSYVAASNHDATAKLWDGTSVIASTELETPGGTGDGCLPLTAVVTPTSTKTYKISVSSQNSGDVLKAATSTGGSPGNATYLNAIQLSGNPVGQQAPAVRVTNSANQSLSNGAFTTLTFDTNRFDQGTSSPQHSVSSNTSRLTCQQSGLYQITANVEFASNATGQRALALRINGSTYIAQDERQAVNGDVTMVALTTSYQLSVGDYVEAQAYQNSGGALNSIASANQTPEFMMCRVDSGPGAVQPNTRVQLDYTPTSDIANPATLTANTWNDIISNQTFNVDDQSSVIEIEISGMGQTTTSAPAFSILNRIVIDSAGTAVTKYAGGCNIPAASQFVNLFSGAGTIVVTGLSPGSHTIKFQSYPGGTTTLYCRPGTQPNLEFFSLRVLERKQSVSPPSSTPAPAVRCYNSADQSIPDSTWTSVSFNSNRFDQGTGLNQHNTSTNPTRLTCQQTGVYSITGHASFAGIAGGIHRALRLLLNGSIEIARFFQDSNGPIVSGQAFNTQVSCLYQLAVGDYVELQAYQDSGAALNVVSAGNYSPEFGMVRCDTGGTGAVYVPQVKTANYTALATDSMLVAGASSLTFTLPAASGYGGKPPFVVKNDAFTGTTLTAAGSDTIDGVATFRLYAAQASVSLVADPSSGKWRSI